MPLHVKPRELAGWVARDEGTQRSKGKAPAVKATGQSNLDHLLARGAEAGWTSLRSHDSVIYTFTNQDGRQLVGSYEDVLRQAAPRRPRR